MQTDMHFYGTYVLARAAGIPAVDAKTIAYAAQFVDDSTHQDSDLHEDGGLLYGIATAHHGAQCVLNSKIDPEEQRRVWVPFHFLPGGAGETLEEKLLCIKNSTIAREMVEHHISVALSGRRFGLELLGIAAHVYMDTFSHYGFSGIGSKLNSVDNDSFKFIDVKNEEMEKYLLDKKSKFATKYVNRSIATFFAAKTTGNLGHGGVATYPDRPFLHWQVEFQESRPEIGRVSNRDNPATFLEGCEKLHGYFASFSHQHFTDQQIRPFDEIRDAVESILRFEGAKDDRILQWRKAISSGNIYSNQNEENIEYDPNEWEEQKRTFHNLPSSNMGIDLHVYRFHQAAALHRYYVLKELLPAHGIVVY